LAEEGDIDVLVIEQNIGVACEVADVSRSWSTGGSTGWMPAAQLAGDRDLQQRLLGVGRHAMTRRPRPAADATARGGSTPPAVARAAIDQGLHVEPEPPTRWSQPVPVPQLERAGAGAVTDGRAAPRVNGTEMRPLAAPGEKVVLVAARWTPRATSCATCAT
jgi:hypothetical protein